MNTKQIKPGMRVRVPAGVPFTSTHPTHDRGITARSQVVVVNHIAGGSAEWTRHDGEVVPATPGQVVWAGASGYWRRVDADRVQVLD